MAGNAYLANVLASMAVPPVYDAEAHPDPPPPIPMPPPLALAPPPPQPNHPLGPALTEADAASFMSAPVTPAWHPPDPLAIPAGPNANKPGAGALTGYDPLADHAPLEQRNALVAQGVEAGPPPPAGPSGAPDVNAAPQDPNAFPLTATGGGGVIPAHEVEMRGPSLLAAQGNANNAVQGAIGSVADRSQDAAAHDYSIALQQEREARIREDAIQRSIAERDEEIGQRQADFDQSVTQLSKMAVDPNHFYATRTTGQKIGNLIGLALGGFLQGARGGSNPGLDAINMAIDRDVRAQEAAWHIQRDVVGGRQTAFGLAMAKYQNADAARSMARAASIDAVQAQMQQSQSLWKGVDTANRADVAMAALQNDKMNQIAQGVKFVLPTSTGRTWVDKTTGLTYNEAQAREMAKELRGYGQDREKIGLNTAGDILKEGVKAGHAQDKDLRAELFNLPTGELMRASSSAEATELKKLSAAVGQAQDLVNEAKTLRAGTAWRFPGTKERNRLETIQSELTLSFKDRGGLGALSGPDMGLANSATGSVMSQMPGADEKLDSFARHTNNALVRRVATVPGAPPKASGKMPESHTYHDGAK